MRLGADLLVILAVLTVTTAILLFNPIVDLLYGWLPDPRVRTGSSQADAAEAKGVKGQRAPEPVLAPSRYRRPLSARRRRAGTFQIASSTIARLILSRPPRGRRT